jgi:Tol biopolymer transport system component
VRKIIVTCFALLVFYCSAVGQRFNEVLLSETENAYNPIPSPNGEIVAYVRTGWDSPGGSGGFGRSNLRSGVMSMNANGQVLIEEPLADAFLSGWTPNGKSLVCYRDRLYFLVSSNGTMLKQADRSQTMRPELNAERAAYLSDIDAFIWVNSSGNEAVIETVGESIAKSKFSLGELIIPSPNERYIAVTGARDSTLWVYDRRSKTWADLGKVIVHPNDEWDYIKPSWNPWFADSTRLAYISEAGIIVSSPDGKDRKIVRKLKAKVGLAVPAPDGKSIAYVTFESRPMKIRSDLQFWGGTTVWVASVDSNSEAHPVTAKNQDTTYGLRWLNNQQLVFDRIADELFYRKARLWKVSVTR